MTPEEAEAILEAGCADAVVIGRQLIADPWWVKKHGKDARRILSRASDV